MFNLFYFVCSPISVRNSEPTTLKSSNTVAITLPLFSRISLSSVFTFHMFFSSSKIGVYTFILVVLGSCSLNVFLLYIDLWLFCVRGKLKLENKPFIAIDSDFDVSIAQMTCLALLSFLPNSVFFHFIIYTYIHIAMKLHRYKYLLKWVSRLISLGKA